MNNKDYKTIALSLYTVIEVIENIVDTLDKDKQNLFYNINAMPEDEDIGLLKEIYNEAYNTHNEIMSLCESTPSI